jgi:aryl hydrocarbon receptor nuclear translocator-like protein 1
MSTNETMSDKRPGSTRRKRKSSRTPLEEREADEDSDGRDPSDVDGSEKQRETHNQIEKRRREKMNSYINELSSLVPKCFQMNKKMDKLTILKLAVQHLKDLRGNPSDEEQLQMKPQFLANDELKYLILEAADGFLFVVSCDRGKLVYVSDSVYPILKQSQHDWIGKKIYDVIHPRDINRVKDQLLTADLPALTDSTETKSKKNHIYLFSCLPVCLCLPALSVVEDLFVL